MGNQSTKVITKIPQPILFFPFLMDDKLKNYQENATTINSQLMNATKWITDILMPSGSDILVEVVSTVLGYLLQCVVKRYIGNDDNGGESITTLQEALMYSQVDEATAAMATSELRAKVFALKNRYSRLLSDIPNEDKKLEIVPALQTCEEILDLFRNYDYVFWKHCFISIPFLISFTSLYSATAILSAALIPNYKTHLVAHIDLLRNTLIEYKEKCINLRLAAVSVKRNSGESIIESAIATNQSSSYCVVDNLFENYNNNAKIFDDNDTYYGYTYDALESYKERLVKQHDLFFQPALTTLENFIELNKS